MPMQIAQNEIAPETVVIALSGKVMMGPESEQIVKHVEDALRHGKRNIIFDLAGVSHIDSTGIGRFISSYNKIMAAGGDMAMVGATGHLFDTFHVSLLDTVFRFYPTVEDACRA
jgi:anti-sigma B factor antagonist